MARDHPPHHRITLDKYRRPVAVQSFTLNITTVQGFETFIASLTNKSFCKEKEGTGVDLVLSCVDNYEARMVVNQVVTMVKHKTITLFFKRTNEEQQVEGNDDEIQESKRQNGSTSEPVTIFKNRLRNKMSDENLANSMVIYIEKEIANKFDSESIIEEFKGLKA
ncbi:D-isomer specific 2-hydroxyacid dehydrogenase, NAD-binding [Artemisia annua]|uniref:D-isomer specific 2-hydroxyacid dehydrogenase, NAD-binding n=1 Tax=Artemisia annua TaxID=35608 RepID=A0A2U1NPM1_ARTAN|nr:D-isomer specific 2-hydroxyacid dehydrogenase, NAD-binding [Artemisia annua]